LPYMNSGQKDVINSARPRIALPQPCSYDAEYSNRALPAYLRAVEAAGGEPVVIPLSSSPEEMARTITTCSAVLLPGSKADVDPQKYNSPKQAETNAADPLRDAADELLLQDAYNLRKPVFGICYGLQSLNVWRSGTLVQHIRSDVDHSPGAKIPVAHEIAIEPGSLLSREARAAGSAVPVNSSHHQSADILGDALRVVARCPRDKVIEAIEGTQPEHYVLAVQWHPERDFDRNPVSGMRRARGLRKIPETFPAEIQLLSDQALLFSAAALIELTSLPKIASSPPKDLFPQGSVEYAEWVVQTRRQGTGHGNFHGPARSTQKGTRGIRRRRREISQVPGVRRTCELFA
jgi:putative glutamine amidotransferase